MARSNARMKILVTGAGGMLGREVVKAAIAVDPSASHIAIYSHHDLDITDSGMVRFVLNAHRPDVVINCAGLIPHREPTPTDVEYRRVNSLGPLLLAQDCDRIGARLIHVSTDHVFAGTRPIEDGPYTEDDKPDATTSYGQSKAFGEITGKPHLTVRCSFVGLGDRGLIAWLRGAHYLWVPQLWGGVAWSGTTAPAIARALVELAQRPDVTGLMHLTSGEMVSKATLIESIWRAGIAERPDDYEYSDEPVANHWLASNRSDVPALPPLHEALRELG